MGRMGATTAANEGDACLEERRGIIAKIGRRCRVEDAPALDMLRPTGVGHGRKPQLWRGFAHLLDQAQNLRGAAAAVYAGYVYVQLGETAGHVGGRIAQYGHVVAGEGDLRYKGHVGRYAARCANGCLHFAEIAQGLDDDQIDPLYVVGIDQSGNLFGEGLDGLGHADPAQRRHMHPKRTDRARQQHRAEAAGDGAAGHRHGSAIDGAHLLFQPVFGQLKAVGAEAVRLQDVGAGGDVITMNVGDNGRLRDVQGIKTFVDGDTAPMQQRAHSAVQEQWAFGQPLFECLTIHRRPHTPA